MGSGDGFRVIGIVIAVISHLRPSFYTHSVPPPHFPFVLVGFGGCCCCCCCCVCVCVCVFTFSNNSFCELSDILLPYLSVVCLYVYN